MIDSHTALWASKPFLCMKSRYSQVPFPSQTCYHYQFVSDGTKKDPNGLWRLFDVLRENGFIPPEVVQAYDVFCKNHPAPGKTAKETVDVGHNGDHTSDHAKDARASPSAAAPAASAASNKPDVQSDTPSVVEQTPEKEALDGESTSAKSKTTTIDNPTEGSESSNSKPSEVDKTPDSETPATSTTTEVTSMTEAITATTVTTSGAPTVVTGVASNSSPFQQHDQQQARLQQSFTHSSSLQQQQQHQQQHHPSHHHHQQNLFPLGPQQMFSCLVPDCVYSTPNIDDYRSHVQLFHPHLQLELLKNALPSPPPYRGGGQPIGGAGFKSRHDSQPVVNAHHHPHHSSNPFYRHSIHSLFGDSSSNGAVAASNAVMSTPAFDPYSGPLPAAVNDAAFATSTPRASMSSLRKDAVVERAVEMHKCIAPDCGYYR